MLDEKKLRGKMAENGLTQKQVARELGMSDSTFYRKMKSGDFGIEDCDKMIAMMHIQNPVEIFFANQVT